MLLSEDILIVQDIMICQVQWHKYTNYTSCSNFTKALSKIQKHSLTASFEFFKLFHLERIPGWADRFAVKTSFSSRLEMYMQYQALCSIKYIGYMNSPIVHPIWTMTMSCIVIFPYQKLFLCVFSPCGHFSAVDLFSFHYIRRYSLPKNQWIVFFCHVVFLKSLSKYGGIIAS